MKVFKSMMGARFDETLARVKRTLSGKQGLVSSALPWIKPALIMSFGAYLLATVASVVGTHLLVEHLAPSAGLTGESATAIAAPARFNYFKFRGVVLDRHLFNSEGDFPNEQGAPKVAAPSEKGCIASSLGLKLIGTIIHDNPEMSVATVVDKNMKVTDVYRQGDAVIDQPAIVLAIEKGRVVLDVSGSRECLEISSTGQMASYGNGESSKLPSEAAAKKPVAEASPVATSGDMVVLKNSYVEQQLGEGFVKIIQSARFVPQIDEAGQAQGFKIFSIKPGTLFRKIGLKDDDIIHQVNSTSLKNVEQGFTLYQALRDESQIIIGVERGGRPVTVKVQIE